MGQDIPAAPTHEFLVEREAHLRSILDTVPDAIIVMADGKIARFGPASEIAPLLPPGIEVVDYGRDALITPGFIDCHVHYPQTQIIGSYGRQLLDWLNKYTFVAEQQFADPAHADAVAKAMKAQH